jgi:hypothetical protein
MNKGVYFIEEITRNKNGKITDTRPIYGMRYFEKCSIDVDPCCSEEIANELCERLTLREQNSWSSRPLEFRVAKYVRQKSHKAPKGG